MLNVVLHIRCIFYKVFKGVISMVLCGVGMVVCVVSVWCCAMYRCGVVQTFSVVILMLEACCALSSGRYNG